MYLTELNRFYDRMAEDPASGMPPEGMSAEQIAFALVIDAEGNLVGEPWDLRNSSGRSVRMFVPAAVKRSCNVSANFLWDNTGYVLGIDGKGKPENAVKSAEAFRQLHKTLLEGCEDVHAKALLAFLEKWTPEQVERLASREALLGANVVFQLKGDTGYLHQQSVLKERWFAHLEKSGKGEKGVCLITGRQGTIAQTHPSIKGVLGAQSSGAALISFNAPAFTSYGKEQNANAPVCESAARSYTSALNYLLQREHGQTVRVGDTSMVFWAERATPAEVLFKGFFDIEPVSDAPQDREQVDRIKGILTALRTGQPLNGAVEDLDGNVRFFVLGLAPNAARLSVRFWLSNTLETLLRHFSRWYDELHIERQYPASEPEYPPLWLLLVRAVAALGKSENLPPELGGQLAYCVLTGRRFPESVYAAILQRIHADKKVEYFRAALIKAYFCRNGKQGERDMETLNTDESNIGYRLGRLFALLEKAQRDALGELNASLRDRYIGAASATPRMVFPMLLRLAQHHVSKAKKGNFPKYEAFFSRTLGEIAAEMTDFPAVLSLQNQGRFMLGYYHQNNAFYQKKNITEETEA